MIDTPTAAPGCPECRAPAGLHYPGCTRAVPLPRDPMQPARPGPAPQAPGPRPDDTPFRLVDEVAARAWARQGSTAHRWDELGPHAQESVREAVRDVVTDTLDLAADFLRSRA